MHTKNYGTMLGNMNKHIQTEQAFLRMKQDITDGNPQMWDLAAYRVLDATHHRTGDKWKIYPTYDFACPIVDSLEGVTHALRTNEYRDRNPQYHWMIEALALRPVHIWDFRWVFLSPPSLCNLRKCCEADSTSSTLYFQSANFTGLLIMELFVVGMILGSPQLEVRETDVR